MTDHGGAASPRTAQDSLLALRRLAVGATRDRQGRQEWLVDGPKVAFALPDYDAAQEAPAPEGLRRLRAIEKYAADLLRERDSGDLYGRTVDLLQAALNDDPDAILAAAPPTPAAPPRHDVHGGGGHDAGTWDECHLCNAAYYAHRAEARPPEGLTLTERLTAAMRAVDAERPGGAYPHLGRESDVRRFAADLAARLSAGGATE